MIRKHGFVSNSSTTSFFVYGIKLDNDDVAKMLKRDHPAVKAQIEEWGDGDVIEILDYVMKGVEANRSEDGYYTYFGVSLDRIGDDETGAQFKERVRVALSEYLEGDLVLGTHEESWYDG